MAKQDRRAELKPKSKLRGDIYEIIFEADTFWGKTFDILLLGAIILSVGAVMLESVKEIKVAYGDLLYTIEWVFTALFTVEFMLRIFAIKKPRKYIFSFFGIVDMLSIIPTYLSLFIVGAQSLLVIRSIRLLRVFRVFKLVRFLGEASQLSNALKASRNKIIVFIGAVFTLVVILGTLMYIIEGQENGFTSIPRSIYWAVVTLTTVGYGDIAPRTVLGQTVATFVMILGYGIIAVPTGIVSAEMAQQKQKLSELTRCPGCNRVGHEEDAEFCKYCGHKL
ncbi:MAG: ion transporter [Bacteroidota bacterium]